MGEKGAGMVWLIVFAVVGFIAGFIFGAGLMGRAEEERLTFWRQKAIDLQVRVHELEGNLKWEGDR